jgi:hypothetical protein
MMDFTIKLSMGSYDQVLLDRFEEAKKEYPDLTWDAFLSWAVRYYLEHAYIVHEPMCTCDEPCEIHEV